MLRGAVVNSPGLCHQTSRPSASNRGWRIPLTEGLFEALRAVRHLGGLRVLYTDAGAELTAKVVRRWLEKAQRRASLEVNRAVHRLRHTFCSLLAMKGAPAKAIQELAGHADLTTTMRYMHLSPSARDSAIRLLDQPFQESDADARGGILETAVKESPSGGDHCGWDCEQFEPWHCWTWSLRFSATRQRLSPGNAHRSGLSCSMAASQCGATGPFNTR